MIFFILKKESVQGESGERGNFRSLLAAKDI